MYKIEEIEQEAKDTLKSLGKRQSERINLSKQSLMEFCRKVLFLCKECRK